MSLVAGNGCPVAEAGHPTDGQMFAVARDRGQVVVVTEGRERLARLIRWKGRGRRSSGEPKTLQNARVEFSTGGLATVPLDAIRLPEVEQ